VEEKDGKGTKPVVRLKIDDFPYALEPLKDQEPAALRTPETSGGLLAAMYVYHRLLTQGEKGFNEFAHGGHEPLYPPPLADAKTSPNLAALRVDAEVLNTRHGPFLTKWFFALARIKSCSASNGASMKNEDPCECNPPITAPSMAVCSPTACRSSTATGHYGTLTSPGSTSRNNRLAAEHATRGPRSPLARG